MKAYFVDLNCLIEIENKAWIIDKSKPNIPIMKISKEDFNLFKSAIYKPQGNKVVFNGQTFWLPNSIYSKLKVKLKNSDAGLANLAISLQEFMNRELIENLEFGLNDWMMNQLKNKTDDIYIICSKQTKSNWSSIIEKLEEKLLDEGIKIKKFYFISETFYNQNEDEIIFKKARLFLQHLVGYQTDDKLFTDVELQRYDQILFYDSAKIVLSLKTDLNPILKSLLSKTGDAMSRIVKENIDDYKPKLIVNWVSDNQINKVVTEKITLDYSNLIKSFESFFLRK
jgi:hypothetical protein